MAPHSSLCPHSCAYNDSLKKKLQLSLSSRRKKHNKGILEAVPVPFTATVKLTLYNNLTLFEVWFYRRLVLVPILKFILIAYGHVKGR